jgi:hypothetical protein
MRRPVPLTISEAEEEGLRRLMTEGDKGEYRRSLAIILRAKVPKHRGDGGCG